MVLHDCWGYAASLQAIWVLKAIKAICMFLRGWVWGCGVVMLDCRAYLTSEWLGGVQGRWMVMLDGRAYVASVWAI